MAPAFTDSEPGQQDFDGIRPLVLFMLMTHQALEVEDIWATEFSRDGMLYETS